MWPFNTRQSLLSAGLLNGWTDWHCHILPGVDDGIRTLEDSLAVLEWYASTGIREAWLTPHIMEDIPNETAALRERFDALCAAYHGPVRLHLAAENMMDNLFEERLAARDLLPLEDNLLLVETSYFNPPIDLWAILERIKECGYRPLLAHPERYVYMGDKEYRRLADNGILLQLNLPSLAGGYGPEAQRKARALLREGCYSRSGSDLHRLRAFRHAASEACLSRDERNALKRLITLL